MISKARLAAAALVLAAGAAGAQEYYTYPTSKNYCPEGLNPISYGGEISCGVPTTATSYDKAMAYPVQRRRNDSDFSYIPTEKGIPDGMGTGG